MEIIRINKNGEEQCYIRCEIHNWFYKGKPPITTGCTECWMCYYMGQRASMKPEEMDSALGILESAINHMAENVEDGLWDFKFDPKIEISHEES